MSDQLDELHAQVGIGLMAADTVLTVVDDTAVGASLPAPPYVRVYVHIERPADHAANAARGLSSTFVVRWYCHSVGVNDTSARAVAMRVRAALLDVRPTIAGRNCGLIRLESSLPPRRDESTGPMVIDTVQVFVLTTTG
jgi:hypothetical protein